MYVFIVRLKVAILVQLRINDRAVVQSRPRLSLHSQTLARIHFIQLHITLVCRFNGLHTLLIYHPRRMEGIVA